MIDYETFRKSLLRLRQQQEYLLSNDPSLGVLAREAVAESVIHRFETCYDCLWKSLKRHLFEELGDTDVPNSPKPVFVLAAQNDLLPSPLEKWLEYVDARIDTSHDYDEDKARACLGLIDDFIEDAIGVYQMVSGKPWE